MYAIAQMLTETTIDSVRNLIASDRQNTDNVKHDLKSLLKQIGFSCFLSLPRIITFLLHEHVLSLLVSKLFNLSLHSSYKFHVLFSHTLIAFHLPLFFLRLHFNCDFHDYLTRSRSTCVKCPSGINLLLVLKPRLFGQGYPTDIPWTVRANRLVSKGTQNG